MKKLLAIMLSVTMIVTAFAGCGAKTETVPSKTSSSEATEVQKPESSEEKVGESVTENSSKGLTIHYPSYMKESEGESLVLEEYPEKIVVLSNSAMQILVRSDVKPIAFRKSPKYIDFPDWVRELPIIETGMNNLDVESIIAMEPDLIIMGNHLKKDYGKQLDDAGIPVYYTSEGPQVTYPEVKEEAITLARSFGTEKLVKEIEADFASLEKRAEELKASTSSKKAMVLFGTPPSYQLTSMSYFGSIVAMLPFDNISDSLIDVNIRMAPLDIEKLVEINPDVIFAISPTAPMTEMLEKAYKEEFEKNPKVWKELNAVNNNNVIYLPSEYVTSKGIHIVKSINALMDSIEEKFSESSSKVNNVTLTYPKNMQDIGFTDVVTMEKTPERVVVMTKAPVLALNKLGVKMIAIPKGGVTKWPENLENNTEKLNVTMNANFDIETVIALNPDLVVLGANSKDTYGKVLTDAKIPVYYIDAGHTVNYNSVKAQTEALVNAFGKDTAEGKEIMDSFTKLENDLKKKQAKYSDKSVMVLQSAPPSHYIQTENGSLGTMAKMMGFKNVYVNDKTSMAPIDMEKAITYNPDLILAVGGTPSAEAHEKAMKEDFSKNADYWNTIDAVKNDRVIYLSSKYIANTGIGFIDNMREFMDMIDNFYKE